MQTDFNNWLSGVLPDAKPNGVVAWAFNIAETQSDYIFDLIGASSYAADDPDWPCNECWTSRPSAFKLSRKATGDWMAALASAKSLVSSFMDSESSILHHSQAVAVGFVDGDLSEVWTLDA
ncbi:MAG: hypothetical protein Aurels2KO_10720 [Aureliella sp.]